ncbi:hypothetical protein AA313_de0207965 [Arthrobotrys entomopaga]|nr:hypothetical protein AA313_de0207965 [Arthrobotrys entomopaga]
MKSQSTATTSSSTSTVTTTTTSSSSSTTTTAAAAASTSGGGSGGKSENLKVEYLPDQNAIKRAMKTGGIAGKKGYHNPSSGWANAEAAMVWVRQQCSRRGNIKFLHGEVKHLWVSTGDNGGREKVKGVVLDNGVTLSADVTVLAAGAWSAGLLDLTGRASSTGQVMAYVNVTEEEEEKLGGIPVTLNLSSGVFYFPPKNGVLKIARHAFGYVNTVTVGGFDEKEVVISRPVTGVSRPGLRIPEADEVMLARELGEMVPLLKGRGFEKTRLCWYTDTPTGDFLVSYHPTVERLFVATGGSGHAFKFLPVLGEKVADAIEGKLEAELKELWRFRDPVDGPVVTMDGSRNGAERIELNGVMRMY